MKPGTTNAAAAGGNLITGRSAFLSLLRDEGVDRLFGNPGTTELPIMHALGDEPDMGYVLGLQEGIVVAMADGYARASGRLAACNVHVAPGLGNAMGSLYNAKFWGSPVLVTAGQQEIGHGLTEPLLYDPLVPIAAPLVKWAVEAERLEDLPRIVRRAAKVALTPPTGPVFLSLPGDILNRGAALDLGAPTRVDAAGRPSDEALSRLAARLLRAERPVIVSGHEVATSDALGEAARFAEALGAPVYQQTVPWGAHFPSEHPAFLGALTRVQKQVREALAPYDLAVFLGADVLKMSVWSEVEPLPGGLPVVQIGLRDWEMGKNYPAETALRADVKETLRALLPMLESGRDEAGRSAAAGRIAAVAERSWTAKRARLRAAADEAEGKDPIAPAAAVRRLVDALPADAVFVDEGLTTSNTLLGQYPFRDAKSYFGLASGGIGFAVAGAVGIHMATPERPCVALVGDGSAMYNIQALWTAAHLELPITYVIANNRSYRILKDRLLAFHGDDRFVGMDFQSPRIDFVGLAESMGVSARRVERAADLGDAVRESIASGGGPRLLDVTLSNGYDP